VESEEAGGTAVQDAELSLSGFDAPAELGGCTSRHVAVVGVLGSLQPRMAAVEP